MSDGEVTALLRAATDGDDDATAALLPIVYAELKRRADRLMQRERSAHTLQPTQLVHDAFLTLVDQRNTTWENRAQFFALEAGIFGGVLNRDAVGEGESRDDLSKPSPLTMREQSIYALLECIRTVAKLAQGGISQVRHILDSGCFLHLIPRRQLRCELPPPHGQFSYVAS